MAELSEKQKMIAEMAGSPEKIEAVDLAALRKKAKGVKRNLKK